MDEVRMDDRWLEGRRELWRNASNNRLYAGVSQWQLAGPICVNAKRLAWLLQ